MSKNNENKNFTKKDYVELITNDYWNTRERLYALIDSIQEDFKLLGIIGPFLIAAITLVTQLDQELVSNLLGAEKDLISFAFFTATLIIYAVLAFRDYYRAVIVEHSLYAVWEQERQLNSVLDSFGFYESKKSIRVANDWKIKFQEKYAQMIGIFTLVLMLPIVLIPPFVLFSMDGKADSFAVVYLILAISFVASYYFIGIRSFNRFEELFQSTS